MRKLMVSSRIARQVHFFAESAASDEAPSAALSSLVLLPASLPPSTCEGPLRSSSQLSKSPTICLFNGAIVTEESGAVDCAPAEETDGDGSDEGVVPAPAAADGVSGAANDEDEADDEDDVDDEDNDADGDEEDEEDDAGAALGLK